MSLPPLPSGGRGRGRRVDTAALSACIEEFARTVTGEFDAPDILRRLVLSATQVLQVDGGGVMAPSDAGTEPAADGVRGERAARRAWTSLQEVLDQGPCRHAFEVEQVVNLADVRTEGNWPQYMAAADEPRCARGGLRAAAGARAAVGVLDLYRYASTPLSEEEPGGRRHPRQPGDVLPGRRRRPRPRPAGPARAHRTGHARHPDRAAGALGVPRAGSTTP
ncbi:hypothetical protein GCM10025868_19280 [Angustibacter aerolatus]|uniref:GAF domain-containing protein n=1 Tax=Angustibacter aerolatus TaxID=1162965 RepID=A0ABQ6JER0_9ACTN|nr:hypothetical protein [Angustibacter aerolatus]GMA86678.1 hypothetical protein GCM10025868_19280 [Angustibacter aerolatus]